MYAPPSKWYDPGDLPKPKPLFALVLWNDEKYTVNDVRHQIAPACMERLRILRGLNLLFDPEGRE